MLGTGKPSEGYYEMTRPRDKVSVADCTPKLPRVLAARRDVGPHGRRINNKPFHLNKGEGFVFTYNA